MQANLPESRRQPRPESHTRNGNDSATQSPYWPAARALFRTHGGESAIRPAAEHKPPSLPTRAVPSAAAASHGKSPIRTKWQAAATAASLAASIGTHRSKRNSHTDLSALQTVDSAWAHARFSELMARLTHWVRRPPTQRPGRNASTVHAGVPINASTARGRRGSLHPHHLRQHAPQYCNASTGETREAKPAAFASAEHSVTSVVVRELHARYSAKGYRPPRQIGLWRRAGGGSLESSPPPHSGERGARGNLASHANHDTKFYYWVHMRTRVAQWLPPSAQQVAADEESDSSTDTDSDTQSSDSDGHQRTGQLAAAAGGADPHHLPSHASSQPPPPPPAPAMAQLTDSVSSDSSDAHWTPFTRASGPRQQPPPATLQLGTRSPAPPLHAPALAGGAESALGAMEHGRHMHATALPPPELIMPSQQRGAPVLSRANPVLAAVQRAVTQQEHDNDAEEHTGQLQELMRRHAGAVHISAMEYAPVEDNAPPPKMAATPPHGSLHAGGASDHVPLAAHASGLAAFRAVLSPGVGGGNAGDRGGGLTVQQRAAAVRASQRAWAARSAQSSAAMQAQQGRTSAAAAAASPRIAAAASAPGPRLHPAAAAAGRGLRDEEAFMEHHAWWNRQPGMREPAKTAQTPSQVPHIAPNPLNPTAFIARAGSQRGSAHLEASNNGNTQSPTELPSASALLFPAALADTAEASQQAAAAAAAAPAYGPTPAHELRAAVRHTGPQRLKAAVSKMFAHKRDPSPPLRGGASPALGEGGLWVQPQFGEGGGGLWVQPQFSQTGPPPPQAVERPQGAANAPHWHSGDVSGGDVFELGQERWASDGAAQNGERRGGGQGVQGGLETHTTEQPLSEADAPFRRLRAAVGTTPTGTASVGAELSELDVLRRLSPDTAHGWAQLCVLGAGPRAPPAGTRGGRRSGRPPPPLADAAVCVSKQHVWAWLDPPHVCFGGGPRAELGSLRAKGVQGGNAAAQDSLWSQLDALEAAQSSTPPNGRAKGGGAAAQTLLVDLNRLSSAGDSLAKVNVCALLECSIAPAPEGPGGGVGPERSGGFLLALRSRLAAAGGAAPPVLSPAPATDQGLKLRTAQLPDGVVLVFPSSFRADVWRRAVLCSLASHGIARGPAPAPSHVSMRRMFGASWPGLRGMDLRSLQVPAAARGAWEARLVAPADGGAPGMGPPPHPCLTPPPGMHGCYTLKPCELLTRPRLPLEAAHRLSAPPHRSSRHPLSSTNSPPLGPASLALLTWSRMHSTVLRWGWLGLYRKAQPRPEPPLQLPPPQPLQHPPPSRP